MDSVYYKKCTTPLPEVRELFAHAEAMGFGLSELEARTGYAKGTIGELRRPRNGRGCNPSYSILRDIAQSLGYEFKLVKKAP